MSNIRVSEYLKRGAELFEGMVVYNSSGDAHLISKNLTSVICRKSFSIVNGVDFKGRDSVWTTRDNLGTHDAASAMDEFNMCHVSYKSKLALKIIEESGKWVFCTDSLEFVPSEAAKVSPSTQEVKVSPCVRIHTELVNDAINNKDSTSASLVTSVLKALDSLKSREGCALILPPERDKEGNLLIDIGLYEKKGSKGGSEVEVSKTGREPWNGKGVPPEGEVCWAKLGARTDYIEIIMGPSMGDTFLFVRKIPLPKRTVGSVSCNSLRRTKFRLTGTPPPRRESDILSSVMDYLLDNFNINKGANIVKISEGLIDILAPTHQDAVVKLSEGVVEKETKHPVVMRQKRYKIANLFSPDFGVWQAWEVCDIDDYNIANNCLGSNSEVRELIVAT
jgi:hypothetical protein